MVRCREGPERVLYSLSVHRLKVLRSRTLKARMPPVRRIRVESAADAGQLDVVPRRIPPEIGCVEELSWKFQGRSKDQRGQGDGSVLLRSGP
jgi:hypothetical protein